MFCNGLRTDEGDIARLGPMTIAGMTSLKVLFVLDHDCGRYRWFVGPISTKQDATTTTNLRTTQLKIYVVPGIYARSLT